MFEPGSKSALFIPWWGHNAVIGDGLASGEPPSLPPDFPAVIAKKGYAKSSADYWYRSVVCFQMPLTDVTDGESVSKRLVEPLCELFERVAARAEAVSAWRIRRLTIGGQLRSSDPIAPSRS